MRKRREQITFQEIIVENSNLKKKLDIKVHEANRTPYYFKAKRTSPRYRDTVY